MSKEAVLEFFRSASQDKNLQRQFRAVTGLSELVKLGQRHGYQFSKNDLAAATSNGASVDHGSSGAECGPEGVPTIPGNELQRPMTRLLHFEWSIGDIAGFEQVGQELDNLKIKPRTVAMQLYENSYRKEDRDFADMSPAAVEFRPRYNEIMAQQDKSESCAGSEFAQRHFHLVNLDLHVDDPGYDSYFLAKERLVAHLEAFFDDEVRFSGSMWYPPNGYRAWHTNETQPGWRMYLIDFDATEVELDGKSYFRYMDPQTGELVTLRERPKIVRFFKIEQDPDKLLWHCIVNASKFSRWSFGFMVSDAWMKRLL